MNPADPFAALGLPRTAALNDDDVRSAWRRIAAATHPDRADGGDPARFAAASAAYTALRTRTGRGEALADLSGGRPAVAVPPRDAPVARDLAPVTPAGVLPLGGDTRPAGPIGRAMARVAHGRPAVLAIRVLIAAAAGIVTAVLVGSAPATPAVITGAVTWLVLTARHDLAPP